MNGRETGGAVVALREDNMRRHQRFNAAFDLADEGVQVGLALVGTARVLRQDVVRVADHAAVSGIVFADGDHADVTQATAQGIGECYHDGRVGMQGAVADDFRDGVMQIQHRREAEINTELAQFISDDDTHRFRQLAGEQRAAVKTAAKRAHRGQGGEAFTETLHPPAFLINTDDGIWVLRADGGTEALELRRAAVIAAKKDDARTKRATKLRGFLREQHRSLNADNDCTHASSRKNAILTRARRRIGAHFAVTRKKSRGKA